MTIFYLFSFLSWQITEKFTFPPVSWYFQYPSFNKLDEHRMPVMSGLTEIALQGGDDVWRSDIRDWLNVCLLLWTSRLTLVLQDSSKKSFQEWMYETRYEAENTTDTIYKWIIITFISMSFSYQYCFLEDIFGKMTKTNMWNSYINCAAQE